MVFDESNPIVKLCARGMSEEGAGRADEAKQLFSEAWKKAGTSLEKCIAAHYLARHQSSVEEKLSFDQKALDHAKQAGTQELHSLFPSLFLNVAKCFEDLGDKVSARSYYDQGLSYCDKLLPDGYGNMIRAGLEAGLKRVS